MFTACATLVVITAGALVTAVPAVTSALQRARAATRAGLPARGQQAVLRSLGEERLQALAAAMPTRCSAATPTCW